MLSGGRQIWIWRRNSQVGYEGSRRSEEEIMNYNEVLANARENIGKLCKAFPVCNGLACRNTVPGPGAKGVGDTAIRNYQKWQEIRVNMDTL